MTNLDTLKLEAWETLARELTNREDGKKPQLHPDSLWNVKLVNIVDTLLTSSYQAGAVWGFSQSGEGWNGEYMDGNGPSEEKIEKYIVEELNTVSSKCQICGDDIDFLFDSLRAQGLCKGCMSDFEHID